METSTTDRAAPGACGGFLLVDKPAGVTSHDVVALIRRVAGTRRVGHTGTLDPFATGLLVVFVGSGTRLIPYIDGEPKVYDAVIALGAETETDDGTGAVTRTASLPDDVAIVEAISRLTGVIEQVPPAYSAKQVGGQRAYDAARKGVALELPPSRVTVHEWTLIARRGAELHARITCSGGTYIRALGRDMGRIAGSAAHVAALRRVRSGAFSVSDAVSIDDLRAGRWAAQPLRAAIPSFPVQTLDAAELVRVRHGNAVTARTTGARVALLDNEQMLVAVAEPAGETLKPKLVLHGV